MTEGRRACTDELPIDVSAIFSTHHDSPHDPIFAEHAFVVEHGLSSRVAEPRRGPESQSQLCVLFGASVFSIMTAFHVVHTCGLGFEPDCIAVLFCAPRVHGCVLFSYKC